MTVVRVTTTTDVVLRHALELAGDGPDGETRWERQARGLEGIGYTIVGHDELARLRALDHGELAERARAVVIAWEQGRYAVGAAGHRLMCRLAEVLADPKLPGPRCRYCGADCSGDRSWDGGELYACPSCADGRAAARAAQLRADVNQERADALVVGLRRLLEHDVAIENGDPPPSSDVNHSLTRLPSAEGTGS